MQTVKDGATSSIQRFFFFFYFSCALTFDEFLFPLLVFKKAKKNVPEDLLRTKYVISEN